MSIYTHIIYIIKTACEALFSFALKFLVLKRGRND